MALAKCRECGNTVSTEALACPHCGAPRPAGVAPPAIPRTVAPKPDKRKRGFLSSFMLVVFLSVGFFFVMGVIISFSDGGSKNNVAPAGPTLDGKAEAARATRKEERRQLELSNVVAELNGATLSAEQRAVKIKSLLALDPNTKEFPSEVTAAREEIESNRRQATELKRLEAQKAAREKQIEEAFSPWDGSHKGLEKVIKQSMNDPKSYDHDKTIYSDMGDYLIVTTTFRGKNAFGGVIKNRFRAKCDLNGNVIEVLYSGQ